LQTSQGELCDDGNQTDGDGCSATCTVENLVTFTFTTALGDEVTFPADSTPAGLAAVPTMSRGAGLSPSAAANAFSSNAFTTAALDNFLAGTGMGVLKFKADSGAIVPGSIQVARFVFSVGQGVPGQAMSIGASDMFPYDSLAVYATRGVYKPDVIPTLGRVAPYYKGDVNLSGYITSGDVIDMVNYIFKSGSLPVTSLADVDGSPPANAGDIIYLINYLFKSGPPPIG